ncbi:MAG: GCN5-related N-acetyltransferase [Chloroflexi bacterium]|nr:GCN5-related N-acetyltransferase [Chloroflexota bacterium]
MDTSLELRKITPDELPEFLRRERIAFGNILTDDELKSESLGFEFDRSMAIFEHGHIVATNGASSYALTLPGLTTTPVAGVGWVSVYPTHRRRGLLRAMMARQLDDIQERGEPLALLFASESPIYGRFGYGIATDRIGYSIKLKNAGFSTPVSYDGTVDFMDHSKARTVLPPLYERARLLQPGAIDRNSNWWEYFFDVPPVDLTGKNARFYLVARSSSGEAEGYAVYRVMREWPDGQRSHTLALRELIAVNSGAYAALWQLLLSLDLINILTTENSPIDEPVRWLLADPRELEIRFRNDGAWVRIVDVAGALAARRYGAEGTLVLEIHDRFHPTTAGRFRLDGSPDGATCRRTGELADLVMHIEDLGTVYLGGNSFASLARAGRVQEETAAALRKADVMFASSPLPWGTTLF